LAWLELFLFESHLKVNATTKELVQP